MSGRGRTRTVLGKAQRAKIIREIVVRQAEATAAIRGCVENAGGRGLVLHIVPRGVKPNHGGSAWLDDTDAVSPAGHATAAATISALGRWIPAQSSRRVESSSKKIWPTSLANGLTLDG